MTVPGAATLCPGGLLSSPVAAASVQGSEFYPSEALSSEGLSCSADFYCISYGACRHRWML